MTTRQERINTMKDAIVEHSRQRASYLGEALIDQARQYVIAMDAVQFLPQCGA